jgi:hypothetical protein
MHKSYLIVRRYPWDEEPINVELEISASNGLFAGTVQVYCAAQDLAGMGSDLQKFPASSGDEYRYELGSEDPAQRCSVYFLLSAYTTNAAGHCALQLRMNGSSSPPNEGRCEFSIRAEAAAINRLGALLEQFSKLGHRELHWGARFMESCSKRCSPLIGPVLNSLFGLNS